MTTGDGKQRLRLGLVFDVPSVGKADGQVLLLCYLVEMFIIGVRIDAAKNRVLCLAATA